MGFLRNLLGLGEKVNLQEWIDRNAKIVDVRTVREYQGGHLGNSINIPLDQLEAKVKHLKKDEPIILCCASGMRSGSAVSKLKAKGFTDVVNGGGWRSLQKYV